MGVLVTGFESLGAGARDMFICPLVTRYHEAVCVLKYVRVSNPHAAR
jgi:hypothetical protein